MKIPKALEAMVADLISDETRKREEVEAILSKIHELTEPFFNPDAPVRIDPSSTPGSPAPLEEPEEFVPAPPITIERQLQNMTRFNMVRGDDQSTAERKSKMALGIED